jgi:hypothetical protein
VPSRSAIGYPHLKGPGSARLVVKASGRLKLTREPKQIDAQLGKQTGAELSALFVRRCFGNTFRFMQTCFDFPPDEA